MPTGSLYIHMALHLFSLYLISRSVVEKATLVLGEFFLHVMILSQLNLKDTNVI